MAAVYIKVISQWELTLLKMKELMNLESLPEIFSLFSIKTRIIYHLRWGLRGLGFN